MAYAIPLQFDDRRITQDTCCFGPQRIAIMPHVLSAASKRIATPTTLSIAGGAGPCCSRRDWRRPGYGVRALNSSYSFSAEPYSYSYSKSQPKRIVSMRTRLIQRTARNADHPIDYEYEYRDAEYE